MKARLQFEMDNMLERLLARFAPSSLLEVSQECGVVGDHEGALVRRQGTPESDLEKLYSELPARFPPLYERLVLRYRWYRSEVNVIDLFKGCLGITSFDMFGNPVGEKLDGLRAELFQDPALLETCLPKGYIQFASGPNGHYDAICFDTSRKNSNRDFAIVWLDHEAILCNSKIRVIQTIAPSFESLVHSIIAAPVQTAEKQIV